MWPAHPMRALFTGLLALSLLACSNNDIKTAASNGDGFGGTGAPVQIAYTPSGDESGFGGTGVIGTIEAFGSIWVNGLHIHYPEGQTFPANIAGDYRLQIGQQVMLQTDMNDQQITSRHIQVYFPLAGQISEINGQRIRINTYWVNTDAQTQIDSQLAPSTANLKVGDYVLLNGWKTDNEFYATRLSANPLQVSHIELSPKWPFEFSSRGFVIEQPFAHSDFMQNLQLNSENIHWRSGRFSQRTSLPNQGVVHSVPLQSGFKNSMSNGRNAGMPKNTLGNRGLNAH